LFYISKLFVVSGEFYVRLLVEVCSCCIFSTPYNIKPHIELGVLGRKMYAISFLKFDI